MKVSDFIRISRPITWPILPIMYFCIFFYYDLQFTPLIALQLLILTFVFNFFLYGINDIYDYKSDELNKRKSVLNFNTKEVKKISLYCVVLLLLSSVFLLNLKNFLAMVLLIELSYFYSAPPLRLKELPVLDSLTNALIVYAALLLPYSFTNEPFSSKLYFLLFGIAGFHAFTAALDYECDKKAKINTLAVYFGKRFAILFSLLTILTIILFSEITNNWINLFFILNLFPQIYCLIDPKYENIVISSLFFYITFIIFSLLFVLV
tara:strand:- start:169 stop:960 length:792 start_codon:yes stop_codon:yes gene_type:complete